MRWKPREPGLKPAKEWNWRFALWPTICRDHCGFTTIVWLEPYEIKKTLRRDNNKVVSHTYRRTREVGR